MKPSVTVSLVPEARGGPFIYWDDLPRACEKAAALGFAGVEIFAPGPEALKAGALRSLLDQQALALAALGTGGGWIRHRLTLTSPDAEVRSRARGFIREMIDLAAPFGAAVIVGSMQGKAEGDLTRNEALRLLEDALQDLGRHARERQVTLLYEHLNRYETNLFNRINDVLPFLSTLPSNVKVLADLFHMSIEEDSIANGLRAAGPRLGHVHLADSNRRPAGYGHTDFQPIFTALREIGYAGYISAEALPYPDSDRAAEQTIKAFRRFAL